MGTGSEPGVVALSLGLAILWLQGEKPCKGWNCAPTSTTAPSLGKGWRTQFQHGRGCGVEACRVGGRGVEGFPTPTGRFPTPAGVLQFNAILTPPTWKQPQIPTGEGSVPQGRPPLWIPLVSPGSHLCFWPTDYKLEVPMTLSLGLINLLERLTELRKPPDSLVTDLLQRRLKDMNQQREEEIRRWGPELPSSWSLGPGTVASVSILVLQPGSSLKPPPLVFFFCF